MKIRTSARNRRWQEQISDARKAILCIAALALLPFPATAGKAKQYWVRGNVLTVEPDRIVILGPKGREFTVIPAEDFTSQVAVGSQVTAWYTPENGVNRLDYLQYALENFFVPPEVVRGTIKKILIVPHPDVPDSMSLIDEIGKYLAANLGWYVAPTMLGEELWKRARKPSPVDDIDPATGQFDMAMHRRKQAAFMGDLVSKARVDAVLDTSVEQVEAPYKNKKAEWDGVAELVATKAILALSVFSSAGETGTIPAATVVMNLYDQQGRILWNRRRGFALLALQTGIGARLRDRSLTEVYQNQPSVQAWLSQTFTGLGGSTGQAPTKPDSEQHPPAK